MRFLVNDQFLVFLMEKSRRRSPSVDPFNHQKSSRYSSLVAVGLWLSFIGLNWTSFSWYAARINSLALSSCLALKHLYKYRVFLKYFDLSSHVLRADFLSSIWIFTTAVCAFAINNHVYYTIGDILRYFLVFNLKFVCIIVTVWIIILITNYTCKFFDVVSFNKNDYRTFLLCTYN